MEESIREKIGINKEDFAFLSFAVAILSVCIIVMFIPFITSNPVLSVVTLGFILVLGSSVHLVRKYLEVRKLEAKPSAEEELKREYVKNEDLDIQNYEDTYEKLKEIEEKT